MSKLAAAPKIHFADRKALRAWLFKNHAKTGAFWLIYDKIKDGKRHLTYADIVEECLCFGFIDSQPRKVSESQASLYISPRKRGSEWSKLNKSRIVNLKKKKLIHASGLKVIAAAKKDGSWNKIDASENHEEPADFTAALEKKPKLRKHFDTLAPSTRKAFLHRLLSAKTPTTRAQRMDFLLKLLEVEMQPSEFRLAFTKGVIPKR
ncbi:MAG: YdeI/OmpD-associated family protein [Leptospiraceae bacterium]|nr:YdeI/OmpD-associated family protein [Leptospiraceae bacterium]